MVLALVLLGTLTALGLIASRQLLLTRRIVATEHAARQTEALARGALAVVVHWFDRGATDPGHVPFPHPSEVQRGLRRIVAADGSWRPAAIDETYKHGVDRDGDGVDDLFAKPYRGDIRDRFLGQPEAPDVRIVDRELLARIERAVLGRGDAPRRPRLLRIDVHAAAMVPLGRGAARAGVARVRVLAGLRLADGSRIRREAGAVLGEIPYDARPPGRGLRGPLHSCAGLVFRPAGARRFPVHWGAVSVRGTADVGPDLDLLPAGPPRGARDSPADPLWSPDFRADLGDYLRRVAPGTDLGDPWFRLLAGGSVRGAPPATQPWPSPWRDWPGSAPAPGPVTDRSHVLQGVAVPCPDYPYDVWKSIARQPGAGLRYFAWAGTDRYREDGRGPARSFREITDGGNGVLFFDTADGAPPRVGGTNLTPAIELSGGRWSFRGLLYVHARALRLADVTGVPRRLQAPGEPFVDADGNGRPGPGEAWIDVDYPAGPGAPFRRGTPDGERQLRAPAGFVAEAAFHGILVLAGQFEATGSVRIYGAVVARGGVRQRQAARRTPSIYWDAALGPAWPGPGLPRVVLTEEDGP